MELFVFMLVILNPFAQVLYLSGLMKEFGWKDFFLLHLRATLLSLGVFGLFVLFGDAILHDLFHVRLASLQIFGGVVMLYIAYRYFAFGPGSNLLFRGDITDLAPTISLPYMVGPGTIWCSILAGKQHTVHEGLLIVVAVLSVNLVFVTTVQGLYKHVETHRETLLGKYFGILMRTNAFFIGAIAVEMIVTGLEDALTTPPIDL